jgi:predicted negative regulator of RcsB-dependent stress response
VAQKSEKKTQQQLRQPDAFQQFGAEASDWFIKRQQTIGIAVAVLAVGGLIVGLVNWYSTRSEERASKELGEAMRVVERTVVGEQVSPGQDAPPFTSQQEKDQAVSKALNEFRQQHGNTRAAVTAALPLGKAEHRLGNHDAALAAFSDYVARAPKGDPLRASALEGQGYAHEAKGQLEQALGAFEKMSQEESGEYLKGMGQYHRARVLVQMGRKDEAAQVLSTLKASQPDTAAGRLATERLAVLTAQGVKVPEPGPATTQDAG